MRVLVTGAFGMIGSAVVTALAARGDSVTALGKGDPAGTAADRVVLGDAGDVDAVREAMAGANAVAHLAALPSPKHASPVELFSANTRATFAVLDEAGRAGVRRAMVASSYSILGLPWADGPRHPPYYPIDLGTPLAIEDPYGLSKKVDEATSDMAARRYGMTVVALRFPFVGGIERLRWRLERTVADPVFSAMDSWSYLDVRDAATATLAALDTDLRGMRAVFVAAGEILAPYPTEALLRRYHPTSELRVPLPGRTCPIDLAPARDLLGFTARHLLSIEPRPLD